jgi:hypothetical protein
MKQLQLGKGLFWVTSLGRWRQIRGGSNLKISPCHAQYEEKLLSLWHVCREEAEQVG